MTDHDPSIMSADELARYPSWLRAQDFLTRHADAAHVRRWGISQAALRFVPQFEVIVERYPRPERDPAYRVITGSHTLRGALANAIYVLGGPAASFAFDRACPPGTL